MTYSSIVIGVRIYLIIFPVFLQLMLLLVTGQVTTVKWISTEWTETHCSGLGDSQIFWNNSLNLTHTPHELSYSYFPVLTPSNQTLVSFFRYTNINFLNVSKSRTVVMVKKHAYLFLDIVCQSFLKLCSFHCCDIVVLDLFL